MAGPSAAFLVHTHLTGSCVALTLIGPTEGLVFIPR